MWETAQVCSSTFAVVVKTMVFQLKVVLLNTVFVNKHVNPINIVYSDNKPKNKVKNLFMGLYMKHQRKAHVIRSSLFSVRNRAKRLERKRANEGNGWPVWFYLTVAN